MKDDDTETTSLREEQGEPPFETPAERIADVPLAPHSAGALGHVPQEDEGEASRAADEEAAKQRRRD